VAVAAARKAPLELRCRAPPITTNKKTKRQTPSEIRLTLVRTLRLRSEPAVGYQQSAPPLCYLSIACFFEFLQGFYHLPGSHEADPDAQQKSEPGDNAQYPFCPINEDGELPGGRAAHAPSFGSPVHRPLAKSCRSTLAVPVQLVAVRGEAVMTRTQFQLSA
jgi:hypothetical protein